MDCPFGQVVAWRADVAAGFCDNNATRSSMAQGIVWATVAYAQAIDRTAEAVGSAAIVGWKQAFGQVRQTWNSFRSGASERILCMLGARRIDPY